MIDFHCHLDLYPDPSAVIKQADKEGVYILAVTTTPQAWKINQTLTSGFGRVKIAVGLHPELVLERHKEVEILCSIMKETRYVGEIGIDGSLKNKSSMQLQQEVFKKIISQCENLGGRIMSIHARNAVKEVLDVLEAHPKAGIPVIHWFSGTDIELGRAVQLGCWFSVGPGMLRSNKGRDIAKIIPQERILTETDGPFVRNASQPLMPWEVKEAERFLAELWQTDMNSIRLKIQNNFRTLISRKLSGDKTNVSASL